MVSTQPSIRLLCDRGVKPPVAVRTQEFWVHHRVAISLAELMPDLVLIQEMKDVHRHADVLEEGPMLLVGKHLLLRITVAVVHEMLGFVRARDREGFFDKQLRSCETR